MQPSDAALRAHRASCGLTRNKVLAGGKNPIRAPVAKDTESLGPELRRSAIGKAMTTETDDEILARFWSKTKADPATGCIQWYGTVNDLNDGIFFDGKNYRSTRFAWQLEYGAIPVGMVITHSCGDHTCVNHEHLRCCYRDEICAIKDGSAEAAQ